MNDERKPYIHQCNYGNNNILGYNRDFFLDLIKLNGYKSVSGLDELIRICKLLNNFSDIYIEIRMRTKFN